MQIGTKVRRKEIGVVIGRCSCRGAQLGVCNRVKVRWRTSGRISIEALTGLEPVEPFVPTIGAVI